MLLINADFNRACGEFLTFLASVYAFIHTSTNIYIFSLRIYQKKKNTRRLVKIEITKTKDKN